MIGSSWILKDLENRKDLNGSQVTIVENVDSSTGRIRVVTQDNQYVRILPQRMQSTNDPSVTAQTFLDAMEHVRVGAREDSNLTAFLSRMTEGNHEAALSAASKWTLSAMARNS